MYILSVYFGTLVGRFLLIYTLCLPIGKKKIKLDVLIINIFVIVSCKEEDVVVGMSSGRHLYV